MSTFADTNDLISVMTKLWEQIKLDQDMSKKLVASKLIVRFRYHEPEAVITVDCSDGKNMKLVVGDTEIKPTIEMSMKADLAHNFWLGNVNLPLAILTGKVISKGPTPKALALLPVIRSAFKMYPKALIECGKEALLPKS